ncbi:MAG: endonuclease III [bacterium]|nr:MAG: endonuclease III [bacterium]
MKIYKMPIVSMYAEDRPREKRSPFKILIATILSLRTKDATTAKASRRLFAYGDSPQEILSIPSGKLEKLIYPVGFYKVKTATIHHVCDTLLNRYGGKVPSDLDELLTIKGVGRKTANLVVTLGFNLPGICVDTHVHRISNRWGYVKTATPDKTETALRRMLPKKYWIEYNDLLVTFGQNVCLPVSPFCSSCKLPGICRKTGVKKSR